MKTPGAIFSAHLIHIGAPQTVAQPVVSAEPVIPNGNELLRIPSLPTVWDHVLLVPLAPLLTLHFPVLKMIDMFV